MSSDHKALEPLRLILFSTSACHLCEQAEGLFLSAFPQFPGHLEIVDISLDDDLMTRYGVSIPVLAKLDDEGKIFEELVWPFDENDIKFFLK